MKKRDRERTYKRRTLTIPHLLIVLFWIRLVYHGFSLVRFVGEVHLALIGIGVVKLHSLDSEYPFNFHMWFGDRD